MSIDRVALGTRKGLLLLERNGSNWSVVHEAFSGSHVSIAFLDRRSGHLFACLDDGHFGNKLFRWSCFANQADWKTASQKEVWNEIAVPKYPEGSLLPNGNDAVLKYQWGMATGSEQQPGRIYMATEPGGLFVTDDHGESWEINLPLWNHPSRTNEAMPWFGGGRDEAGIHSVCVDPRNDSHIRVGISCAGVFLTEDGGETWRPTNKGLKAEFLPDPAAEVGHDPHLLVQCFSQPDTLWQQNHCGVFKSYDAGCSWDAVSDPKQEPHFGFTVAVDPEDGNTAWVIPAESDQVRCAVNRKLSVCRTTDGGQNWQRFANGLPQDDCFDFAFRHGLVYDDDTLVFGTACGSLYFSGDRGENWDAAKQHLPPIYCVTHV